MRAITTTVNITFSSAEEATKAALDDEGFGVLTEIDVAATLHDKLGVDRAALKILGACNPQLAPTALQADPTVSVLLPCSVVIEETPAWVQVSAADPRELMDDRSLTDVSANAASRLHRAVDVVADTGQ